MTSAPFQTPPPFLRLGPAVATTPLVIAVPHAGRYYPDRIENDRAVALRQLEDLEDRYADRLVQPIVAAGAVAIVATHARAWIDLNRGREDAADPDATDASPRARAGLGLVPSRVGGRALWRRFPDADDITTRLATIHAPYHRAIGDAIRAARAAHGVALLIDCHSMPPLGRPGRSGARIVIGDRHGTSAAPIVARAIVAACARHALPAERNAPYAGAFTIEHHGRPSEDVHAIQLEVDRSLYLQNDLREPSEDLSAVAETFARLCIAGLDSLGTTLHARAAE